MSAVVSEPITGTDRLQIVKMLAQGMGLGLVVAANPHIKADAIRAVAHEHGHPSVAKLQHAAERLAQLQDDPDAIPTVQQPTAPAAGKPEPLARKGMFDVPVDDLHHSPANPRERMTDIEDLAASMREVGLIQPIVAQKLEDGTLQIVAGHRRHLAAKMLGWSKVPVLIRRAMLPDTELVTMLIENGQRAGLDPIEEARALSHLKVTQNLTDGQVAKKVGRSQPTVSARLALLSLSWEEQEAIRRGEMMLGEAADRGRLASGRVRPGASGKASASHLSVHHNLAPLAKARCIRLQHPRGGGASVGRTACGECWESVIRADERQHLHQVSSANGNCAICGAGYGVKAEA